MILIKPVVACFWITIIEYSNGVQGGRLRGAVRLSPSAALTQPGSAGSLAVEAVAVHPVGSWSSRRARGAERGVQSARCGRRAGRSGGRLGARPVPRFRVQMDVEDQLRRPPAFAVGGADGLRESLRVRGGAWDRRAGCGMRDAGCGQDAGCGMQDAGCWARAGRGARGAGPHAPAPQVRLYRLRSV